jgi:hypothetical protein
MSLPQDWVNRIFDKLTLTYGQSFLDRWRDIDLKAVKADWGFELATFEKVPHCIAFALANLPATSRGPSVVEFKALCRQAPELEKPRLPEPKADPERVAAELAKLAPIIAQTKAADPMKYDSRAWAKKILTEHKGGLRRTPTVVAMARRAMGEEV